MVDNLCMKIGLKTAERMDVQEKWMKGVYPCISATVSFGMGVDKATVRAVVHWGAPQSVASYYQVGFYNLCIIKKNDKFYNKLYLGIW